MSSYKKDSPPPQEDPRNSQSKNRNNDKNYIKHYPHNVKEYYNKNPSYYQQRVKQLELQIAQDRVKIERYEQIFDRMKPIFNVLESYFTESMSVRYPGYPVPPSQPLAPPIYYSPTVVPIPRQPGTNATPPLQPGTPGSQTLRPTVTPQPTPQQLNPLSSTVQRNGVNASTLPPAMLPVSDKNQKDLRPWIFSTPNSDQSIVTSELEFLSQDVIVCDVSQWEKTSACVSSLRKLLGLTGFQLNSSFWDEIRAHFRSLVPHEKCLFLINFNQSDVVGERIVRLCATISDAWNDVESNSGDLGRIAVVIQGWNQNGINYKRHYFPVTPLDNPQ